MFSNSLSLPLYFCIYPSFFSLSFSLSLSFSIFLKPSLVVTFCSNGRDSGLFQCHSGNYRRILQGFAVVGRVVSSRDRVRVLDLQKYCRDLHITITDTSPWVLFGENVHRYHTKHIICYIHSRLIDHGWEMILLNECRDLAKINEQGLESVHKVKSLIDNAHVSV